MKSREHVTTNGRAVFFAAMWEDLKNAAISHGWALGLHGSLNSDMDIMAMPWDEHASSSDVMINQLCLCFTEAAQIEKNILVSTDKPNNRIVYTLPIWDDFYLDINIIAPPQPEPVVSEKADVISFLLGEGALNGTWFGDPKPDGEKGNFLVEEILTRIRGISQEEKPNESRHT